MLPMKKLMESLAKTTASSRAVLLCSRIVKARSEGIGRRRIQFVHTEADSEVAL